jgi:polygalacturonase
MICLKQVVNATVSGIILRDPHLYTVVPNWCDSVTIDNIKLIGLWRYNTDGIHPENSCNMTIKNCFVRAFDDAIVFSGSGTAYQANYRKMENIVVDNCVIWNDWGRALEIGAGTVDDTIRNITFKNCYIPHFTAVAMDIQNCDRACVTDIHYQNISIEEPISDSLRVGTTPLVQKAWGKIIVLGIYGAFYSYDTVRGTINNISFENIRYDRTYPASEDNMGYDDVRIEKISQFKDYDLFIRDNQYFGDIRYNCTHSNTIYLSGYDSSHMVSDISIKDYFIDGKKETGLNTVGKNEFVKNVVVE